MSDMVRWEPWRDLVGLRAAMDRLFDESFVQPGSLAQRAAADTLAVDMYETDEAVVIEAAIPGVKAEDVEVSLSGDVCTIRGETRRENEVKEDNFFRRERYYGSFCRSLSLPVRVVADKADAVFKDGVLTLTLPKAEEARAKTIKVKAR